MGRDEFVAFVDSMRVYRDKFIAHLDSERTMNIPHLQLAQTSTDFYHQHIVADHSGGVAWGKLDRLAEYEQWCKAEAGKDLGHLLRKDSLCDESSPGGAAVTSMPKNA